MSQRCAYVPFRRLLPANSGFFSRCMRIHQLYPSRPSAHHIPRFIAVTMANTDGAAEVGKRDEYIYKWSKELTEQFIRLRDEHDLSFTGTKNSASVAWRTILKKMGLQGKVTPLQAKKKWDNLKKYIQIASVQGQVRVLVGNPRLQHGPGLTSWMRLPSAVVSDHEEDEESEPGPARAGRKRGRDELLDLIKEDMRLQREVDERREQESRERTERLFSLLKKIVNSFVLLVC